jgi:hypothetical protein
MIDNEAFTYDRGGTVLASFGGSVSNSTLQQRIIRYVSRRQDAWTAVDGRVCIHVKKHVRGRSVLNEQSWNVGLSFVD